MAAPANTPRDEDIAGQIESFLDEDPEFAGEGGPEKRKQDAKTPDPERAKKPEVDSPTKPDLEEASPAKAEDDEGDAEGSASAAKGKDGAEDATADADDADAISSISDLAGLLDASEEDVLEGLSVVPAEGAAAVSIKDLVASYNSGPPSAAKEIEQARSTFEAKRTELEQEYGAGMSRLQELATGMLALMKHDRADMERVKEVDPAQYIRLQEAVGAREKIVADAIGEMQTKHKAWQQENTEEQTERYSREMDLITEKMPEWKDPEKAKAAMSQIQGTLLDIGYTQPEIEAISDHREMVTAWKASEYDRMVSQKKGSLERKVLRLPKSNLKRSARDEGAAARKNQKAETSKWERLEQSGDARDAAELMFDMLDD
jgi:hypothetical protein